MSEPLSDEFSKLYHQYWRMVYAMCLARLRDPQRAEDTAMDVFLKKWKAFPGFDQSRSFENYLRRNTVRKCWDELGLAAHRSGGGELPLDLADSPTSNPERIILSRLPLQPCLEQLPEEERQILLMRHDDEFTLQEIAKITGLSFSQVRTRLARAERAMRSCLSEGG